MDMDSFLGRPDDDEVNLFSTEEEVELLKLSNEEFAEGIANLIEHMLDSKDRRVNAGNGTSSFFSGGFSSDDIGSVISE